MKPRTRIELTLGLVSACGCSLCASIAGPEAEITAIVRRIGEGDSFFARNGGRVVIQKISFDQLLVKQKVSGFLAVSLVDAEALFQDRVRIHYVGLERIPFERQAGHWAIQKVLLPGLEEVIALCQEKEDLILQERWRHLDQLISLDYQDERFTRTQMIEHLKEARASGNGPAPVAAWTIRLEREGAEVLEERTLPHQRRRFLLRREGGQLRFVSGLL
jgi:hypothetical protein